MTSNISVWRRNGSGNLIALLVRRGNKRSSSGSEDSASMAYVVNWRRGVGSAVNKAAYGLVTSCGAIAAAAARQ